MLSLRLTRWLLGYVRFDVIGGSPERFYTNCARSGAYLWNIAPNGNAGACVSVRRYRFLRRRARRAGCRLRVRERRGLPFKIKKAERHPGLWAGAAAFLTVCFSLSLRVWCVNITGCGTIPRENLERSLAAAGLAPGSLRSAADAKEISRLVMLEYPQIRWMSVNLRGSAADVVLQEKTEKPEIADRKTVCNVKAAYTGQIISLRVFAGTPQVHLGDAAAEGQLLVSAVVEDQMGGSTLVHASAEIMAETHRSATVRVPFLSRAQLPAGGKLVRRSLEIFGAELPLSLSRKPAGNWEKTASDTAVTLFGTALPLRLYTERWQEMREVETVLSREEARALAEREIAEEARRQLGEGGRVTASEISESEETDALVCTARLTCEENIAKEAEISIK
jgi:similar to stage IV sporulation protein